MPRVAARLHHRYFHAAVLDPVQREGSQQRTDTDSLLPRIDGHHVDLADPRFAIKSHSDEAGNDGIHLGDPYIDIFRPTGRLHRALLIRVPIGMQSLKDAGLTQDVLERGKDRCPCPQRQRNHRAMVTIFERANSWLRPGHGGTCPNSGEL